MMDRKIRSILVLADPEQKKVLFRESKALCSICRRPLEVYYAEDRVYVVRCSRCEIVSVLRATNPENAASWVGASKPPLK